MVINGADEVDPALNLVKGRGGALLREKMVAEVGLDMLYELLPPLFVIAECCTSVHGDL